MPAMRVDFFCCLQNHCIDGECGGWSWCESCGSALGFLAAAASLAPVVAMDLKGKSLSCPWNFVQLGWMMGNWMTIRDQRQDWLRHGAYIMAKLG